MSQADPSRILAPLILPRPVTGFRRQVQIVHGFTGPLNLLSTEAAWDESIQPNYVVYADTPPQGPKQRTLHSRGVTEIGWRIAGEVTSSSFSLLNLLKSESRGTSLVSLYMNQGPSDNYLFSNLTGISIPWANFTIAGNPGGAVTFTLEGRSTSLPAPIGGLQAMTFPDIPVPSWYSGNQYVVAWSLSHSFSLTPKWRNNLSPYPAYYRPGHSEFTIQVSTAVALREHTLIRFGVGFVALVEAVVSSRNRIMGEANAPVRYEVTSNSARVSDQEALIPSVDIALAGGPSTAGFS